jgi:hypothetical protein
VAGKRGEHEWSCAYNQNIESTSQAKNRYIK